MPFANLSLLPTQTARFTPQPSPPHPPPLTHYPLGALSLSPFPSLPGPSVACLPLDLLREKGSSPQKPSPPLQSGDGVLEDGWDVDGWVGTALDDRGRCRGGRRQVCCAVVPVCCTGEAGDDSARLWRLCIVTPWDGAVGCLL